VAAGATSASENDDSVTGDFGLSAGWDYNPPGMPTDCGLIGAAQFLQTIPFATFVEADWPQIRMRRRELRSCHRGFW